MNSKIILATAMLAFFVMANLGSATYNTTQSWKANGGNLGDAYVISDGVASNYGSLDYAWSGILVSPTKYSLMLLKFSINESFVQLNTTIENAFLYLWTDQLAFGVDFPNITIYGFKDDSWVESAITYNSFYSSYSTYNATYITSNSSLSTYRLPDQLMVNVTKWVQYVYANGWKNVSFFLNESSFNVSSYVDAGYAKFVTKENSDLTKNPYLNVTYVLIPPISLLSPTNTTYYNNYTLPLNISNNTFNYDTCFYSINGGNNISFTPNTNILSSYGINNIVVWCNDTAGNWYGDSNQFIVQIKCNSTYSTNTICGGDDMSYLIMCKRMSYSTYDWNSENMTYCSYGCFDGQCIQPNLTCSNRCKLNDHVCISSKEVSECVLQPSGCYNWNTTFDFCKMGCSNGVCITGYNKCGVHESKCQIFNQADYLVYCLDEDGDGYLDWSVQNKTQCTMGCKENWSVTTGWNATCNYHSFDDMYAYRNALVQIVEPLAYGFSGFQQAMWFLWFFLSMALGIGVGYVTKSWQLSIMVIFGMLAIGGFIGWFPIYISILLIVLAGGFLFMSMQGGGGEE